MAKYCKDKLQLTYVLEGLSILERFEDKLSDEDEDALIGAICEQTIQLVAMVCPNASRHREELEYDLSKARFFTKHFEQLQAFVGELRSYMDVEVCLIIPDHEPNLTWGWSTPRQEISGLCAMMIDDASPSLPKDWSLRLWSDIEAQSGRSFESLYDKAIANPRSAQLAKLYRQGRLQQTRYQKTGRHDFALGKAAQYAAEGQILTQVFRGVLIQHEENCPEIKDKMYRILGPTLPIIHPFD